MPETDKKTIVRVLTKRFIPLYIAEFSQSFVLWYSIEKLFMKNIGFNDAEIGLMVAVYSAVMLCVGIPSGILADRWSRKGVLIIGSVLLALSSLIGALSHNIPIYLVATVLWGMFFAFYTGMYDSIVYDTIAEASLDSKYFDYFFGRIQLMDGLGLVSSALAGGFLASLLSLRFVYFLSIPTVLISIIALVKFKEPTLHKKHVAISVRKHMLSIFKAVLINRPLMPVVIVMILQGILLYTLLEFCQLWLIALHTRTAYYGIADAVLLSSFGLGGIMTDKLHLSRYRAMLSVLVITLSGCVGVIIFRSLATIVISQFAIAVGMVGIGVIFSRIMHDNLGASIRSGASSATSTISRFLIIPIALTFGYISKTQTVYSAGLIILALALVMSLFVIIVANRDNHTGLEPRSSNI